MGIGNRRPIVFLSPSITTEDGGGGDTIYFTVWEDYAIPKQITGNRNITEDQTSMDKVYRFDELRQVVEFVPDKSMQIEYNGRRLTIVDIKLQENIPPFYYTIIAGYNEQE